MFVSFLEIRDEIRCLPVGRDSKPCRRDVLNKDKDGRASIILLFCFCKECEVNVGRS